LHSVTGVQTCALPISEDAAQRLGLFWGVAMGSVALGSLVAPTLVHLLGTHLSFALVGSLLPLLTIVAYRRLGTLDLLAAPTRELNLIAAVPMFAPLSLAAKEHLAKKLAPVDISAGTCVVRAGDAGDRFYIVDTGDLRIAVGDSHKAAHAGDYFGEIALLRDTPRTATVTATTDAHLYELDRADFLAAVTGHALATTAAEEVVDARLAGALLTRSGQPR